MVRPSRPRQRPSRPHQPRPNIAPPPPKELKVAGQNACRALFEKRRDDIRRVYVTEENLKAFGDVLKWCAQKRIAYHVKTSEDLDQIAETVHHDGVLFLARERAAASTDNVMRALLESRGRSSVVLLENVKNPHNLGAILRVCAHFGVNAVLAAGETPSLSPAVMRTAEGGAEHVDVVNVNDGLRAVTALKSAGYTAIATSSHESKSLADRDLVLPDRCVVLFGSEGEGLSKKLLDAANMVVAIPGSGALESLNVACASSVILWELWRRRSR